jgi:hypothetical protein
VFFFWNNFSMDIKKYGAIISAFLLAILGFINGRFTQVNAATTTTVLPVAKDGTGANSQSQALINLGKVNSIDANSTDNQFPSAKAAYNYGQAIAAGTITGEYFDIHWEKFANKTALLTIPTSVLKKDLTNTSLIEFMVLPSIITADKTKNFYPYSQIIFCVAYCTNFVSAILYIECGNSICRDLNLTSQTSAIKNSVSYINMIPLLYNTTT